jgi:integrase
MAKQLTAAAAARLRPSGARREVRDGGAQGLYLVIQPSGVKSWALRFRRPGGRTAKLTLGPADLTGHEMPEEPVVGQPLTLAGARALANNIHRERAMGRDVVATQHRAKSEQDARGADTFGQAAVDFIEQHAKRRTRRWAETARLLGVKPEGDALELIPRGLADRWRDRAVREIDGDDVHRVVDEVREKGVPGLERRAGQSESRALVLLRALSKMFAWLVAKRRVSQNPCAGVHRPETPRARDRVLGDPEVIKFWRAAGAEREPFQQLLKLLLLTGCRLREVAGMRRSELSEDGASWTIPGERTKNRRAHVVPLAPTARGLLADAGTEGDLVFTTNGSAPVSGWSKIKKRLDAAMRIPSWRLHDLRRTAATGMAEIGVAPHVIEACLNHISGAKAGVAGVYNRAAYAAEKRVALTLWAAHVEGLVEGRGADVVAYRRVGS